MPQGRDEAGNLWEVDDAGNPVRLIQQAGQQGLPSNPLKVQEATTTISQKQADTAGQVIDNHVKGATAEPTIAKAGAEATKAGQETRFNGLSPDVYNKALAQWNAANQLDGTIAELAAKFQAGPGATHGFAGLEDYLPLTANQQFDRAANSARGIVRNALGLTGGEANTAAEAQMNLGSYIPQASDRDPTIADSITRLTQLRNKARAQSIQTLGGVPDASGKIHPVPNAWEQPYATEQAIPAAAFGATKGSTTPIPPAMQDEYNKYLSAHLGNIDPQDYVQFRLGLDAKYGMGKSADTWKTYLDEAGKLNQAAKGGAQINATIPAPERNLSQTEQFRNDLVNNPVGAGVTGWTDNFALGVPSLLAPEKMSALNDQHKTAMMLGGIGGAVAGTELGGNLARGVLNRVAPQVLAGGTLAKMARAGLLDTVYGTITGVNQGQEPLDAAVSSVVGSGLGQLGGKAVGAGVGGIRVSDAVKNLRARGIPLTTGQILGGKAKAFEDALTSLPIAGDMVNARRLEGLDAFNQAAFNLASTPLQQSVNATGPEAIGRLSNIKNQAYRDALDHVQIDATDPRFVADLGNVRQMASQIPDVNGARDAAHAGIDSRISGAIDPNTGMISGRNFQEAYRGLSRTARERKMGDYGYEIGNVMGQGQDALRSALETQNPGSYQAFLKANAANRALNVLSDAVNSASNQESQLFTPAQLNRADVNATKRLTSKVDAAVGNRPFASLAPDAQAVLPSKLPDSGTARRAIQWGTLGALTGAGAGLGAGAGYLGGNTADGAGAGAGMSLGLLSLLALGGSKTAQRLLVKGAVDRPDALIRVGDQIGKRSGMFGAAAVPLALESSR